MTPSAASGFAFKGARALYTNGWTAERSDPALTSRSRGSTTLPFASTGTTHHGPPQRDGVMRNALAWKLRMVRRLRFVALPAVSGMPL